MLNVRRNQLYHLLSFIQLILRFSHLVDQWFEFKVVKAGSSSTFVDLGGHFDEQTMKTIKIREKVKFNRMSMI